MPTYTNLPQKSGELKLAKQLQSLDDPEAHYWFSVDFLPGVNDVDIVLYHQTCGAFCIEVKAVSLSMIETFTYEKCKIKDRESTKTPQSQAYDGQVSLRNFFDGSRMFSASCKCPFFVSTAFFPLISRSEFKQKFTDPAVQRLSESLFFQEDIGGGLEGMKNRLKFVYLNPPLRRAGHPDFVAWHSPRKVEAMRAAIGGLGTISAAPSDLERLQSLEQNYKKEVASLAPLNNTSLMMFTGYPGTGKTFRLLQVAIYHVQHGKRVLYVCFNKTLAADIRRLLSFSVELNALGKLPDVYDVWDLLHYYSVTNEMEDDSLYGGNFEEKIRWAKLLVEDMEDKYPNFGFYDTVLIDEAQDMEDWAFRMLEAHAKTNASIFVASGHGQELYGEGGEESAWLTAFGKRSKPKSLRRNFRNTKPVFRMAQTVYETKFDVSKIVRTLRKFESRAVAKDNTELAFDRELGRVPLIFALDELLEREDDDKEKFGLLLKDFMVVEYAKKLRDELSALKDNQKPIDLMVLVPSKTSQEQDWAKEALRIIGCEFTDYTSPNNRRNIASAEKIRFCTFHSSRGLEAHNVVIFGMENIIAASEGKNKAENLAYIVLSRANFNCTMYVRRSKGKETIDFLERVIRGMQASPWAIPDDKT